MPALNNWNTYDTDEVSVWSAAFRYDLGTEPLLVWQDAVLGAGERHEVFRIERVDGIGFDRSRDGFAGDFLASRPGRIPGDDRFPENFVLRLWMDVVVATRLTIADPADPPRLRSMWATEMGSVALAAGVPGDGSREPMTVYTDGASGSAAPVEVRVDFGTSTDIWFPWNRAGVRRVDEPLDNRVVAAHNGGRLNAFLREVRAAAIDVGGTWTWEAGTGSGLRRLASDGTIVLPAAADH